MKFFTGVLVFFCLLPITSTVVCALEKKPAISPRQFVSPRGVVPKLKKGALVKPVPLRVTSVQFSTVTINNQSHLVAGVIFNKRIATVTVMQNANIRLLKKNANHFWVDASTQNNIVRVTPNAISWVSGAPLENGYYVMHLRGTIKSEDGLFLDCNGDGVGEGGNLPPYESQIHQVTNVIPARENGFEIDLSIRKRPEAAIIPSE